MVLSLISEGSGLLSSEEVDADACKLSQNPTVSSSFFGNDLLQLRR
jgi:hypothetical protein